MATKSQITPEQYLATAFEYDAEYVHGEVVVRAFPDLAHSRTQARLCFALEPLHSLFRLLPCIGVRMKLFDGLYRVADIAVFADRRGEDYPEAPPVLIAEIIVLDDRHHYVMEKLEDFRAWGVPNIWVIDPYSKRFWTYTQRGLERASALTLPGYPLELTPAALFSDL